MEQALYGYVNGIPTYSRDEHIFARRGFGAIETDEELLKFAEKVTNGWYHAGWTRTFTTFYLSDYALSEPGRSLTKTEYTRLKELQRQALAAEKEADKAREWQYVRTECFADNSEEEIWRDKDGIEKRVMTVYPHGD